VNLRKEPDSLGRQTTWKIVSTMSGLLGALVARKLLRTAWAAASRDGSEGPILDPADRRFSWKDATLWAVTAGIGLGIARLISARLAVAGWEAATGTLPPGVEEPVEV
jgi:hypothetical protein